MSDPSDDKQTCPWCGCQLFTEHAPWCERPVFPDPPDDPRTERKMSAKSQTTKIPWAEWISDFDASGSKSLWRELLWLTRNGLWCWATNTRPLIFGAGRLWHDGPHWFAHFGWVSVRLSVRMVKLMPDQIPTTVWPKPCAWWNRILCAKPIHESALGWDCAVCGRHSPPNLNKREIVPAPRGRAPSLSGVFLA